MALYSLATRRLEDSFQFVTQVSKSAITPDMWVFADGLGNPVDWFDGTSSYAIYASSTRAAGIEWDIQLNSASAIDGILGVAELGRGYYNFNYGSWTFGSRKNFSNGTGIGSWSFANNKDNYAIGDYSNAHGYLNIAFDSADSVEGYKTSTANNTLTILNLNFNYSASTQTLYSLQPGDFTTELNALNLTNSSLKKWYYNPADDVLYEITCLAASYNAGTNLTSISCSNAGDDDQSGNGILYYQLFSSILKGEPLANHAEGDNTIASGDASHAEGYQTISTGLGTHAEGINTLASNSGSHAEGRNSIASGDSSHAEGTDTVASGNASHARGYNTEASGENASATGFYTSASGDNSTTFGRTTSAQGKNSIAGGIDSYALGDNSTAIGNGVVAYGESSLAIGKNTVASGSGSTTQGGDTVTLGRYSHAEGSSSAATGHWAHAEGQSTIAYGTASHAEGISTLAYSRYSHAEGEGSIATSRASHAEGYATLATKLDPSESRTIANHAEGRQTTASGFYAHAEGLGSHAIGDQSHAEGYYTIAFGQSSHTEGSGSIASGSYSHAEGLKSIASGSGSHAEGINTISIGAGSHAEGSASVSIGIASHAGGLNTISSGAYSFSAGDTTIASGYGSFAVGTFTTASGQYSFTAGSQSVAFGKNAAAFGLFTIASGTADIPQTAVGRYNLQNNIEDLFVVGAGDNPAGRANAFGVSADRMYASNSVFFPDLQSLTQVNAVVIDTSTGELFWLPTSSFGAGGGGSAISFYSSSTLLTAALGSLVITGSGVTATVNGTQVTMSFSAGGGSTSPGGSNTQIQYNNAGTFGGVTNLTWDGTTLRATGSFTGSFTGTLIGSASHAVSSSHVPIGTGLSYVGGLLTNNLSVGVSGGQSAIGGTASGNNLTLSSTTHATKGKVLFGANSAYDEVNVRLGIGTASPTYGIHLVASTSPLAYFDSTGALARVGVNHASNTGFGFYVGGALKWSLAVTNVGWAGSNPEYIIYNDATSKVAFAIDGNNQRTLFSDTYLTPTARIHINTVSEQALQVTTTLSTGTAWAALIDANSGCQGLKISTNGQAQYLARASGVTTKELRFQQYSDGNAYFGTVILSGGTASSNLTIRTSHDTGGINNGYINLSPNNVQNLQVRKDGVYISPAGTIVATFGPAALSLEEGIAIETGTITGTVIAHTATAKLAIWGATPIIQPASDDQLALVDATGGTIEPNRKILNYGDPTIDDNFATLIVLINELRNVAVNFGLMKGSI